MAPATQDEHLQSAKPRRDPNHLLKLSFKLSFFASLSTLMRRSTASTTKPIFQRLPLLCFSLKHALVSVCPYMRVYVCVCVCIYIYIYICMYVCMYV